MGDKTYTCKCTIQKKTFHKTETNEDIPYLHVTIEAEGQHIKLSVPKESKQLLEYLIKDFI